MTAVSPKRMIRMITEVKDVLSRRYSRRGKSKE